MSDKPDTKIKQQDLHKAFVTNPIHWFAMGFGTGLVPKAPGTVGTLAALPFILLTASQNLPIKAFIFVLMFLVGIWFCGQSAKALGAHDHGSIVWDEIAGFYLTMLLVPVSSLSLLVGFLLFRVFDILKPWPIRQFDAHIHGGLGIMLDDLIAGLFAGVLLLLLHSQFGF